MADALGAVSSVITIIETCGKIAAYIRDVKDGPNERTRLLMEVLSTKGILESLRETIQDVEQESWSETIRSIHQKDGPVDLLHVVLTSILTELVQAARAKGVAKLSKTLFWPFTKKDVEQQLKTIDRQKLLLTLALENDHVALSREIQANTKAIHSTVTLIQTDVTELRSTIEQRQHQESQTLILDWLTQVDYAPQQNDFISLRQPRTGEWLLESDEFKSWIVTGQQTLFCPGIPGAGKTILTSVVIDHLTARFHNDNSVGIAYLYCNFRRKDEQKAIHLLSSLLRQLAAGCLGRQSSLPDSVQMLYEKHGPKETRPLLGEVYDTLQQVVVSYSRVFVLVDALDECEAFEASQCLTELLKLQVNSGMNIFATARHVPEIMEVFKGAVSLEIRATSEDVGRFVDGHMSRLPSFVRRSPELQEEVKRGIVEAVDGMFLLAQLHLNSLVGKRSPKALRTSLAKLPSGSESSAYDHAYDEAMERIEGQVADQKELAKQVLMWISCAPRLLRVEELQHALAVEVDTSSFDEDNLPQIEDMVSICAGLVVVDEESSVVRLVHYTTQHYFERTQARWFSDPNVDIATACITYLLYDDFEAGFCTTRDGFKERLDMYKFYDYAASHWGYHARQSSTVTELVVDFLRCTRKVQAASDAMFYSKRLPYDRYIGGFRAGTGLHVAAYFGFAEDILGALINDLGPDPMDNLGRTPLSWAAETGRTQVVQYLLDNGASVGSKDEKGLTPIWFATRQQHDAVLQFLTDRGADINVKDGVGWTPLSWAALMGREDAIRVILDHGAVIDPKDDTGFTPLMTAVMYNRRLVTQLLLDRGADINAMSNGGTTALMLAATKSEAMVELLLARGAEVNRQCIDNGESALSVAALQGDLAIVKLLLSHPSTDPDITDSIGRSPLFAAVRENEVEVTMVLLGNIRVDPNRRDFWGITPLLMAVMRESVGVVSCLLTDKRVEINAQDRFGRTALWWARKRGNAEFQGLLLENAKKRGIVLGETDLRSTMKTAGTAEELDSLACDVCTLKLCRAAFHHWCRTCNGGDFDICAECYELGARCLKEGHELAVFNGEEERKLLRFE